ncbi:MAG: TatD family hydrolase [Candidatus Eremiobacteraeota bacterium]|nr:TatD family hydrolase [Candidatus Eremiobacteraeota bacterium]
MIDSHAHVHYRAFDGDRADVLQRAAESGIEAIITVGCDMEDSARAAQCAQNYGLRASLGIHPHEAKHAPADIASAFNEFLGSWPQKVVAIGETGLDYFYMHSSPQDQRRVLKAQIRFAWGRSLPVIFHQRDAFDDFVALLQEEFLPTMRGVVHCFTGDAEQALLLTNRFGLKLGIGGVLTFKNATPLRNAVRSVGPAHLLLETDCPYLAPVPHRGKRNEPAFAAQTAEVLSTVLDCSLQDLACITNKNTRELFNL